MRIVIDIKPVDPTRVEATVSLSRASLIGEYKIAEPVQVADIPATIGTVVQRMVVRAMERPDDPPPEGMRVADVGIAWLAFSTAQIHVPTDAPTDPTSPEFKEAVRLAIKRDGLPEIVDNQSVSLIEAVHAYGKGEDQFYMSPETEIDLMPE